MRAIIAVLLAASTLVPSVAAAKVLSVDRIDGVEPSKLAVPKAALPDVSTRAGILVANDGRVLWERRADDRRAIASITKIMTAVVALERSEPDDIVTVGRESVRVGESTSYLRLGQRLPMSEMLEALLVKSGNDASIAVANHVSGSEDSFVKLMNAKARSLGLDDTRFANSHGLDQKGHYSTARDLQVLTRYAMSKPEFATIVRKRRARIGKTALRVQNTNLLIGNYRGATGVKTGFTADAGQCLVGAAERDGVSVIAVVLGAPSELARLRDARDLLDFGFAHYRAQTLVSRGSVIGEAPVIDYLDRTVTGAVSRDTTAAVLDFAGPISRKVTMAAVKAPVRAGDRVGVATFTQRGEVIATVALVATEDVDKPSLPLRIGILLARAWRGLTGSQ